MNQKDTYKGQDVQNRPWVKKKHKLRRNFSVTASSGHGRNIG
jgi:hypothetical protein